MATTEERDVWWVYDEIGVPHLERFLNEGADWSTIDLSDEEIDRYARITTTRWFAQVAPHTTKAFEYVQCRFMDIVMSIVGAQDRLEFADDGRVWATTAHGERVQITERNTRHFQWVLMLLSRRDVAERFLNALPTATRDRAMFHAVIEAPEVDKFLEIMRNEGMLAAESGDPTAWLMRGDEDTSE